MSEETKAIIDILETYWKKGGFYEIPTEIINDVKGELEDKDKEIEKLNKQIEEYQKALDEAGRETNSSIGTIYKCCNGTSKTCGGYKWKFILDKVD